ncbi:protein-disulfide reductase DsbD domain-containing protein [Pararhodobacter sp. SW119]|uniref:protein-disulfide reductase DsbD domain-containing protein n=1 Tax=Pararhodobacter sp. SW119 TaxID=2780075 RepID=UPI001ADF24C8|nr:protein-disulfide reductase DsbD domain-containing protein [Pararhodobacter sp. SW119]
MHRISRPSPLALIALLAFCIVQFGAPRAAAQVLGGLPPQILHAELRPGWQTAEGVHVAALHLQLAEGWKTYWRIPGEAGIAPQFDWSRSQNAASVRARWPRPVVFDQNGYRSIGYANELVLPLEVTPRRAGRPVALRGEFTIGICSDICIPVDLSLAQVLRGGTAPDPLIAAALTRGTEPAAGAGLGRVVCSVRPGDGMVELELRAQFPRQGGDETLVIELPGTDYWMTQATSRREGGELVARANVRGSNGGAVGIERSVVAFTILTETRMLAHQGCNAAD